MKLTIIGECGNEMSVDVKACAGCPLFGIVCGLKRGNLRIIPDNCPMMMTPGEYDQMLYESERL